jgi:hypothetical protein
VAAVTAVLGLAFALVHRRVPSRAVKIDRQWVTRRKLSESGPPKSAAGIRIIPAASYVETQEGGKIQCFVSPESMTSIDHYPAGGLKTLSK